MIWTGTLLCLLLLTACQSAPDKPTNSDTGNTPDSSVLQFSNPVENNTDAGGDVTSISDANMELVRSVNGTAIEETITMADGKQIILNAQVDTENVESVKQYQYEVLPVTDELRKMLFTTFLVSALLRLFTTSEMMSGNFTTLNQLVTITSMSTLWPWPERVFLERKSLHCNIGM